MSTSASFVLELRCKCGNRDRFGGKTERLASEAAYAGRWSVAPVGQHDTCASCNRAALSRELESFIFDAADTRSAA